MLDGADHDEADETEDRWGAEGADRVGGAARAVDGVGPGAALRGPPEPDLRVEEAAAGARGAGVRSRDGNRGRGGPGARAREAARQDRRADRGARFFSAEVRKMSAPDRRGLLDRDHGKLSIRRQCALLGVARSGVYRAPRPANDNDLAVMRRLDELFTAWPFLGSRRLAALARFGTPAIFNTDQGSQFTSAAFTGRLAAAGVKISMDGRGRWMDNVFIERLWRSLKHEDVYLKGYADGREARAGIGAWIAFYNSRRPHQALANRTPMAVWRAGVTGALGDRAVDMTLVLRTSLDNAGALPTSPQPPQQQERYIA